MKKTMFVIGVMLAIAFAGALPSFADIQTNSVSSTPPKPKPDLLKTCPVSGDKLGEMGQPYVFIYKGQQVKLCCPSCKEDFDKNPDKYMKIIRTADKPKKK
jgi:YHS domain-containing protein